MAGEEHEQENNEHDDWHNIIAGGKQVLVSKKTKNQQQPLKTNPSTEIQVGSKKF